MGIQILYTLMESHITFSLVCFHTLTMLNTQSWGWAMCCTHANLFGSSLTASSKSINESYGVGLPWRTDWPWNTLPVRENERTFHQFLMATPPLTVGQITSEFLVYSTWSYSSEYNARARHIMLHSILVLLNVFLFVFFSTGRKWLMPYRNPSQH